MLYPLSYEGLKSTEMLVHLKVYTVPGSVAGAVLARRETWGFGVASTRELLSDGVLGCPTGLEPVTTGSTDQCSAN